ncbi:Catenin alpha-2 [Bagarius yarrelli]|uniref:Catenin alpha-2 n=1 Tax=Bagarius yarrelli TaxID=175774 RepID=A0A556V4I5_BAGYA|nr:Catenin alpha-2 [Bagarius yarrelli]
MISDVTIKMIESFQLEVAAAAGRDRSRKQLSHLFSHKFSSDRYVEPQTAAESTRTHIDVANLACSISNNEEGVKLVRMAATQIDSLCPQVINAALTLAARPQSKVAQDNMDVFKDQWEKQVRILTEAVDDITSVDDFLSVSENHILEDVNKCVIALQEGDMDTLDRTAGAIRGRAARVVHIINAEMENYEPGVYTERVLESIKLLSETGEPPPSTTTMHFHRGTISHLSMTLLGFNHLEILKQSFRFGTGDGGTGAKGFEEER